MDESAFLRAVLERPNDDGPRLVYADWLDEHSDPRGEFVRVQCQLARLAEHDPRRLTLEDRERELLTRYEAAWLGELPEAVRSWTFRRGWLDRVTLRVDPAVADWPLPATVSALALDLAFARGQGPARAAGDFLAAPHPARLTALELNGGWPYGDWDRRELVSRVSRLALHQMPDRGGDWLDMLRPGRLARVADLELSGPWLTAEDLAGLAAPDWAERWTGLSWHPVEFAPAPPPVALLSACRHLRRLHLSNWPPQPPATWPHLSELIIDHPATLADLVRLGQGTTLPRLHRLGLSIQGLRRPGPIPALIAVLDRLAWPALHLRTDRLEQDALANLVNAAPCRRYLVSLTVEPIAPERILRTLAEGPLWDALTDLELMIAQGPAAIALLELLRSPALGRLRRLRLECHHFSAAAAQALAGSPFLGLLRELRVRVRQFGPGALATLASWPGLARLTRLEFSVGTRAGFDLHLLADAPALSPLTELHLAWPGAAEDVAALAALRVRLGRRLVV